MEEKKKSNKAIIIIMLLLLGITLIGSGYYIYEMTYTDNNGEDLIDDDEDLLYKLDIYKNNYGICLDAIDDCSVFFSIPTKTEKTKLLGFSDDYKFIIYSDDDKLKIYNKEINESQGLLLENNYLEYKIYPSEDNLNIIGISYKISDNKYGYFNVKKGTKLYENSYNTYGYQQVNDNYITTIMEKETYLLNSQEDKVELTYKGDGFSLFFKSFGVGNKHLYGLYDCGPDGECGVRKIYSNDKKEIYNKIIRESFLGYSNNTLYINEDNTVKSIDLDANIKELKKFNDIKGIINNYIVFVENSKIKLENIETNEIKDLGTFANNYFYDYFTSGFYTKNKLDMMNETDKEEGLYIVINYPEKDKNGNYGIEYCLNNNEIKTYEIKTEIGGRAKPVIYLYPTKKTNVKIEFSHPEYLTTTYPKYNNNWEVLASSNGDLYDKDNKYYYALYYDEIRYNEIDFHEGFYVKKENAINFLEEKLDILGLNKREKNEFIMYWLPILENNENNLVYFEQTEERERGNKLNITPKPDSLLRICIHIKKVNDKVNIKEQKLNKFKRTGFTVVEWGGMTY